MDKDLANKIKKADHFWLVSVLIGILAMAPGLLTGLYLSAPTAMYWVIGIAVTGTIIGIPYLYLRHLAVKVASEEAMDGDNPAFRPRVDHLPARFIVCILGSGGHTTEMMEIMRKTSRPAANVHRRYVLTEGDEHSVRAIGRYERALKEMPELKPGTFDIYQVTRARRVHQSRITAPFTCLISALDMYHAFTSPVEERDGHGEKENFKHPHMLITNGPATGLIAALVAHLMKMLYLTDTKHLTVLFIETWAHVRTLSLTGRLVHACHFADMFIAQHTALAREMKCDYADFISPPLAPKEHVPDIKATSAEDDKK